MKMKAHEHVSMVWSLLGEAVASARRALAYADKLDDKFEHMAARTTAADALHQRGAPADRTEARALFKAAETLQCERQPEFDLLYSLRGFQYCDLLLAPAERAAWQVGVQPLGAQGESPKGYTPTQALAEAERRATKALEIVLNGSRSLLDIALNHLTLARVALYRALLEPQRPSSLDLPHATAALDGLRKAGQVQYLPPALLTAALHQHVVGDTAAARRHLDEAQQIAERGPMPLYLADVHLHRARLVGSVKDEGERMKAYPGIDPKAELAKARALIEKHHYGRRTEELAYAEAAAAAW